MTTNIFFEKVLVFTAISLMSIVSIFVSQSSLISTFSFSPLIIAILFGMILTNIFRVKIFLKFDDINSLFTKEILRVAITLYGFRLTFQDIQDLGFQGFFLSFLMLFTTFLIGFIIGIKILKLDKQLTILISAGSSICGAAAVMATESVLKNKPYKTATAVSTVVLFGTLGMFLFPFLYKIGFLDLNTNQIGAFLGVSLHEVAHVVGSSNILDNEAISNDAVIAKMLRVLLLAPFLLFVCFSFNEKTQGKSKIVIPWFAIFFIVVAFFNSFSFLDESTISSINSFDDFLLAASMFVLGIKTDIKSLKSLGIKPFILAFILFVWLFVGGYALTLILI